jgi:hypothetical protein
MKDRFSQYSAAVQSQVDAVSSKQDIKAATPTQSDHLIGHICGRSNNRSLFRFVPMLAYHAVSARVAGSKDVSDSLVEFMTKSASQLPASDGHTNQPLSSMLAQYFGRASGFSDNMAGLALRAKSDKSPATVFFNGRPVSCSASEVLSAASEVAGLVVSMAPKKGDVSASLELLPLGFDAKLLNSAVIAQTRRCSAVSFNCMPQLVEAEIPVLQRLVASVAGCDLFALMQDFAKRLSYTTPGSYAQEVVLQAAKLVGYDRESLLFMAAEQQEAREAGKVAGEAGILIV